MTEETYEELCERHGIDPEQGYTIWDVKDIPEELSEELMKAIEEMDPTYWQCVYCEGDVRVEEDSFESHLRERHGVEYTSDYSDNQS